MFWADSIRFKVMDYAKVEDGRALTKVLTKAQSSGDGRSAEQNVASQGSQAEPRPASTRAPPKATAVQLS